MEFFFVLGLGLLAFPIIAIVALVKTIGINDRLDAIEARLAVLGPRTAGAPGAAPQPAPSPPQPPPIQATPAAAAEPPRVEQPAPPPPPKPTAVPPTPPAPPTEPVEPERVISFEERFGTRWTVWIGGVALALGGIFLVKYSIEAGLVGPGMRLFFGAMLAAALVIGGEWARRQKQLAGFAGFSAADIPSILTAAGTTVAYATVYAAYGLYGFLDPAFAFVLLGAVALATLGAALLHGPALAALGLVGAFVTPMLVASAEPELLGALHLSRGGDGGGVRAGARAPVAMAGADRGCLRLLLAATGRQGQRRRCAGGAPVPHRRGLWAVGRADRRRPVLRPVGGTGKERSALGHRAHRL